MYFECLANELILDIFEYLYAHHLLQAFSGLNARFNQLLYKRFQAYHLDFRSIKKSDFENLCQLHLPLISDRILSFDLSDNDETPNLPKYFLSYQFHLNQFKHLQSLSLFHIQTFTLLNQFISQCSHLKSLSLRQCYFNYSENEMQCLMNQIWRLKNLTSCLFDQITLRKMRLMSVSIVSFSIKSLIFEKITCDFKDLSHLIQYTPNLRRLSINLIYGFLHQQIEHSMESITSLNISYHGCLQSLMNLFHNLPNLVHLTIETYNIYCDGKEWKTILISSLSNLREFHLKMNLDFPDFYQINEQVKDLIETFRNPFWIDEHHWFVRCDWDPSNIFSNGILYTLPYRFNDCFYFDAVSSISTCPNEFDHWSYDHVQRLSYGNPENHNAQEMILFSTRFSNLRHLKISLPFNDYFWSCLASLNRLKSINITLLSINLAYTQLQLLFDRAINLYSLKVSYLNEFPLRLFSLSSCSLRRFDFLKESQSKIHYFNNYECLVLIHSSLLRFCEILLIGIQSRASIIQILNTVPSLRSLTCQCQDDDYNSTSLSSIVHDELLEWLKQCLPSTYSISRDEKQTHLIRFWIA